jgi:phosphoribosylaminoimidazole carboxylase
MNEKLKIGSLSAFACNVALPYLEMSDEKSNNGAIVRVGVLGGGQLGRMMAFAAHKMGIQLSILDPLGPESPAGQVAHNTVTGSFRDVEAIKELIRSKNIQVLTMEIEHVHAAGLDQLAGELGIRVFPSGACVELIQDKYLQKKRYIEAGLSTANSVVLVDNSVDEVKEIVKNFGGSYPVMLKNRRMAYDGRGNFLVRKESEIGTALAELSKSEGGLYAEQFVDFEKEIAVMAYRGPDGKYGAYPVVETIQKDNICHITVMPSGYSAEVEATAQQLARKVVEAVDGVGIFGVEMFVTKSGEVLINEAAPRPHNSGHYTMEACYVDQFEQHLRMVTGLAAGDSSPKAKHAIMINILGDGAKDDESGMGLMGRMRSALQVPGTSMHWYGKEGNKKGRKLGHMTIVAQTPEDIQTRVETVKSILKGSK